MNCILVIMIIQRQKLVVVLAAFLFFVGFNCAKAADGCLVGNVMYGSRQFTLLTGPVYNTATIINAPINKCFSGASGSCRVCDGDVSLNVLAVICVATSGKTGLIYNGTHYPSYTLVNCPLDDYNLEIFMFGAFLGLIVIKKRFSS